MFTNTPDLAAGVLASSDEAVNDKTLDHFVPTCRDPLVLSWVSKGLGDRYELKELVSDRLAQLGPTQPSATMH